MVKRLNPSNSDDEGEQELNSTSQSKPLAPFLRQMKQKQKEIDRKKNKDESLLVEKSNSNILFSGEIEIDDDDDEEEEEGVSKRELESGNESESEEDKDAPPVFDELVTLLEGLLVVENTQENQEIAAKEGQSYKNQHFSFGESDQVVKNDAKTTTGTSSFLYPSPSSLHRVSSADNDSIGASKDKEDLLDNSEKLIGREFSGPSFNSSSRLNLDRKYTSSSLSSSSSGSDGHNNKNNNDTSTPNTITEQKKENFDLIHRRIQICSKKLNMTDSDLEGMMDNLLISRSCEKLNQQQTTLKANRVEEVTKIAEHIDLAFVLDATGSMESILKTAKENMKLVINRVQTTNKNLHIRVGAIIYRDFWYPQCEQGEECPFTDDTEAFENWLGNIKARWSTDNDVPEDVCGGLERATKLEWQSSTRVLVLITDAPCHGKKYHDSVWHDKNPFGDPLGRTPEDLLVKLTDNFNVTCYFGKMRSTTDKMIAVINSSIIKKDSKEEKLLMTQQKDKGTLDGYEDDEDDMVKDYGNKSSSIPSALKNINDTTDSILSQKHTMYYPNDTDYYSYPYFKTHDSCSNNAEKNPPCNKALCTREENEYRKLISEINIADLSNLSNEITALMRSGIESNVDRKIQEEEKKEEDKLLSSLKTLTVGSTSTEKGENNILSPLPKTNTNNLLGNSFKMKKATLPNTLGGRNSLSFSLSHNKNDNNNNHLNSNDDNHFNFHGGNNSSAEEHIECYKSTAEGLIKDLGHVNIVNKYFTEINLTMYHHRGVPSISSLNDPQFRWGRELKSGPREIGNVTVKKCIHDVAKEIERLKKDKKEGLSYEDEIHESWGTNNDKCNSSFGSMKNEKKSLHSLSTTEGEYTNDLFLQYKGCFKQIRVLEMESFGPCILKQLNAVKLINQMNALKDLTSSTVTGNSQYPSETTVKNINLKAKYYQLIENHAIASKLAEGFNNFCYELSTLKQDQEINNQLCLVDEEVAEIMTNRIMIVHFNDLYLVERNEGMSGLAHLFKGGSRFSSNLFSPIKSTTLTNSKSNSFTNNTNTIASTSTPFNTPFMNKTIQKSFGVSSSIPAFASPPCFTNSKHSLVTNNGPQGNSHEVNTNIWNPLESSSLYKYYLLERDLAFCDKDTIKYLQENNGKINMNIFNSMQNTLKYKTKQFSNERGIWMDLKDDSNTALTNLLFTIYTYNATKGKLLFSNLHGMETQFGIVFEFNPAMNNLTPTEGNRELLKEKNCVVYSCPLILSNKVNGFGVWDLGPTALKKVLVLTRSILQEYFLKENQDELLLRFLSFGFDRNRNESEIAPFIRDTEEDSSSYERGGEDDFSSKYRRERKDDQSNFTPFLHEKQDLDLLSNQKTKFNDNTVHDTVLF